MEESSPEMKLLLLAWLRRPGGFWNLRVRRMRTIGPPPQPGLPANFKVVLNRSLLTRDWREFHSSAVKSLAQRRKDAKKPAKFSLRLPFRLCAFARDYV